ASPGDTIKVGLIGCGGRGSGAAKQTLNADKNVILTSMGDAFQDRLKGSLDALKKDREVKERVHVTPENCFIGLDAYQKVQADEAVFRGDMDPLFDFAVFFQRVEAALEPVLKGIAHRSEDYVFVGVKGLFGGAGSAATAADEADFDGVAGGC